MAQSHHDWTGFYAGVHAGLLTGDVTIETTDGDDCRAPTGLHSIGYDQCCEVTSLDVGCCDVVYAIESSPCAPTLTLYDHEYDEGYGGGTLEGLVAGLLAGVNAQHDAFVFGAEVDFGLSSAVGNGAPAPDYDYAEYGYLLDWNAHLRGRLGVAVDRTLFFIAGGLALANFTLEVDEKYYSGTDTQTLVGGSIGGGVEHAFTDNLSGRLEYLLDLYRPATFNLNHTDYQVGLSTHTIRASLILSMD